MNIDRRNTKQKEIIKNTLMKLKHPTADEVYSDIKNQNIGIGRATVFRNLRLLEEENNAVRIVGSIDGGDRFDANIELHDHFMCLKCGVVIDVKNDSFEESLTDIETDYKCLVLKKKTNYYGYCNECMELLSLK